VVGKLLAGEMIHAARWLPLELALILRMRIRSLSWQLRIGPRHAAVVPTVHSFRPLQSS
jgi:hypothetical protein